MAINIRKGNVPKTEKKKPETEAKAAVELFEEELKNLETMKEDFQQSYPEAQQALEYIKHQEDLVMDKMAAAKILVAAVKKTIGDFKCQIKHKQAHYDDTLFTALAGDQEDGDTIVSLINGGHIKKITLDKSATTWFARNPAASERYLTAWQEKKEMTPAITVPKL